MTETRLAYWQRRFADLTDEARLEPLTDSARDTLIWFVKGEAEKLAFGPLPSEPEPAADASRWWDR